MEVEMLLAVESTRQSKIAAQNQTACRVSAAQMPAFESQRTCNCAREPLAQASAKAVTPASPIWLL